MSTNLRKAQKHMQRATELLNRGQLGFGTGDNKPGVGTRARKRRREAEQEQIKLKTQVSTYMRKFVMKF